MPGFPRPGHICYTARLTFYGIRNTDFRFDPPMHKPTNDNNEKIINHHLPEYFTVFTVVKISFPVSLLFGALVEALIPTYHLNLNFFIIFVTEMGGCRKYIDNNRYI